MHQEFLCFYNWPTSALLHNSELIVLSVLKQIWHFINSARAPRVPITRGFLPSRLPKPIRQKWCLCAISLPQYFCIPECLWTAPHPGHTCTHAHPPGLERSSNAPLVDDLIHHHLEASELLSAPQRTSLLWHCTPQLHLHTVINTHCLVVSVLLLFNNYKDHVYVYMYCHYKMPPMY